MGEVLIGKRMTFSRGDSWPSTKITQLRT